MIIFSPGPANISERVRKAMTLPDICHRDTEFTEMLDEVRSRLLKVCSVSKGYSSVVFTGSGTAAIESAISSLNGAVRKIAIISNGVYGTRAEQVAGIIGIDRDVFSSPVDEPLPLNEVEKFIKGSKADVAYLVHHETTTGLLNPLKEIAKIAKASGKFVMVDGVSSIGGEELDLPGWGVDLIIGSANKCIRGVPGLSFIVINSALIKKLKPRKKINYYLDLITHLEKEDGGETPFTPAVPAFFAFREALREILEEGVENRIGNYKKISKQLRDGLKSLGLKILLSEKISSNTMTSVVLPGGMSYDELHLKCKEKGFVVYNAQGELKGKVFRLGTVGIITPEDIKEFLKVLKGILNK